MSNPSRRIWERLTGLNRTAARELLSGRMVGHAWRTSSTGTRAMIALWLAAILAVTAMSTFLAVTLIIYVATGQLPALGCAYLGE